MARAQPIFERYMRDIIEENERVKKERVREAVGNL
jgi:hypothetical protein